MRRLQQMVYALTLGLLAQVSGQTVFHDTFQTTAGAAPNIDYALRQINGLVTSSYGLTTDGGRVENGYIIRLIIE